MAFRWLDSGAGVPTVQRYLWMPVEQYSYRSITVAAYNHMMNMSLDYHSNKDTGEVYTAITQGRSVNGFIEMVLFSVFPMMADLVVAFAYLYLVFGIYMAAIVSLVSGMYMYVTSVLSRRRLEMRYCPWMYVLRNCVPSNNNKESLQQNLAKRGACNVGNDGGLGNRCCMSFLR